MEPSGRNRWQPVANGQAPKTAQTSRSATGGNHGKEGVDGSSPSEGFRKEEIPVNREFLLSVIAAQSTSALPWGPSRARRASRKVPANRPLGPAPRSTSLDRRERRYGLVDSDAETA